MKVGNLLSLLVDEDVLLCQFGFQFLDAGMLAFHLSLQVLNGLVQLFGLNTALLQFVLQLGNHVTVLLHHFLDEGHVLANHLLAACRLARAVGHRHSSLGLVNAADAFLNHIDGSHYVVQFQILLIDDSLQGIAFLLHGFFLSLVAHKAGAQHLNGHCKNQKLLHNPYLRLLN